MRTLLASFMLLFFFAANSYAQEIKFAQTEINYGKIEKGADGVRVFKFTNSGAAPLIISNAQGSCGCTVPTYPKEPIMPGASAEISVKYDTQRVGQFTKYVTLTTNALNNTSSRLTISGEVMAAETTPTLSPAAPASTAPKM
jgi:hypothetical protein